MKSDASELWSALLWRTYLPMIESGTPFYLAADSNLIHSLARLEEPEIPIDETLHSFHLACNSLVKLAPRRAYVADEAFKKISSKPFSRVICLAVQQVLVVETMLNHDDYSDRSYFPRYRDCIGLHGGYKHENPLKEDFQKIWSTLRYEIQAVNGSGAQTITFAAGTGIDVNRNLPLSQALLTGQDLTYLHRTDCSLRNATIDGAILNKIYQLRSGLNRRAQELLAKASTDERLRKRLCEQIRSFVPTNFEASTRARSANSPQDVSLVAYLESEDWLDELYYVFERDKDQVLSEAAPGPEKLDVLLGDTGSLPLAHREDHYEEISVSNPFEQGDQVSVIVRTSQLQHFEQKFLEQYPDLSLVEQKSNLPPGFSFIFCGRLPHSKLFDPFGRRSKLDKQPGIEMLGGLAADARTNLFLCGYPPTAIYHGGKPVASSTSILVNGTKCSAQAFLERLRSIREFTSYLVQVNDDTIQLSFSNRTPSDKGKVIYGFPLEDSVFEPTACQLNDCQPSLQGTQLVEVLTREEHHSNEEIRSIDLLMLLDSGDRLSISPQAISIIVQAVEQSQQSAQLVAAACGQIHATRSIPTIAIASSTIRRLLSSARST